MFLGKERIQRIDSLGPPDDEVPALFPYQVTWVEQGAVHVKDLAFADCALPLAGLEVFVNRLRGLGSGFPDKAEVEMNGNVPFLAILFYQA